MLEINQYKKKIELIFQIQDELLQKLIHNNGIVYKQGFIFFYNISTESVE